MATCTCRVVNGYHLDSTGPVPGIISIAISPSSAKGYNTGTVTITAHGFDMDTGPYLTKGGGSYCGFLKIQGSLNWILKLKCAVGDQVSNMDVPGTEPASGRGILIPQIQNPVIIETGDGALPNMAPGYTLDTDSSDLLNTTDGNNANLIPSYTLDGSSGPNKVFNKGYRREYKWAKFIGLHPLFTFNTKTNSPPVDEPITIEVTGGSEDPDVFDVYPQSFSLVVEPPRPALITFTYIYIDNNKDMLEIDNC
jgi:hypothetical protein